MHGRLEGEERKQVWHMLSEPAGASRTSVNLLSQSLSLSNLSEPDSALSLFDSFVKDGRTVRVGDCALFQAGNAPPFIGIIRCFTTGEDDGVKICVNWLYRPADVKLAKGILLDAAPNEVFYSFHKDLISAASLLHPCKVAFLQKGVELPSGILSFVCRRVYDITNKCLWWLTDQDYINERQEEVNHLLNRTPLEMHTAVPSGGCSPKPHNGRTSTQPLKPGSESVQNSGASSASQSKSRKRDRSDQCSEQLKRERIGKPDDVDSSDFKYESMIKGEIAKITERGGLTSTEDADKLVNLMQLDRLERKIDLSGRILIAEVIAATDRCNDCLGRILQLRGLPILDSWLQEAHKRRTGGDGSSPKENDKVIEELLLSLLRALDKLPVDLHALQSCNIGKSVNHLRSHKNGEIHKKAKSLVDTWKKRVDAEMTKINEAKSVGSNQPASSPAKGSFPDGSQAGNKRGGATDGSGKGPLTQPSACKTMAGKPAGPKDQLSKILVTGGSPETPSAIKEEKSSSSSQSQNNSQSCSSDHGKAVGSSWKEDARSSTAGSLNGVKGHGGSSRRRRPSNGHLGANPGVLKEGNLGKASSLSQASSILEKASQSGLTCEKSLDMPAADQGNNQKFIVKFSNPGRIAAPSASGVSLDDPSVTGNRVSSPGIVDRPEHSDRRMRTRSDVCRSNIAAGANAEPFHNSDITEGPADGLRHPTAIRDDEYNKTTEDSRKPTNASRNSFLPSGKEKSILSEPRTRDSFSPINALIESCAKYSQASVPLDVGDDVGMNLLASVAAGEISKSELTSPSGSPRTSPAVEDPSLGNNNEVRSRLSCDKDVTQSHVHSDVVADADSLSQGKAVVSVLPKDESIRDGTNFSGNDKTNTVFQDEKPFSEQIEHLSVSSESPHKTANFCHKSEGKYEDEMDGSAPVSRCPKFEENVGASEACVKQMANKNGFENSLDCKPCNPMNDDKDSIICPRELVGNETACTSEFPSCKVNDAHEAVVSTDIKLEKLVVGESSTLMTSEVPGDPCSADQRSAMPLVSENTDPVSDTGESKTYKSDVEIVQMEVNTSKNQQLISLSTSAIDELAKAAVSFIRASATIDQVQANMVIGACQTGLESQKPCSGSVVQRGEHQSKSTGCMVSGTSANLRKEIPSSTDFVIDVPDATAKLDFDLNEGILADDGNQGEPSTSTPSMPNPVYLPGMPHANPTTSNSLSVPITIVAPAKGPFVPLENLLKSKGEHGWKGSAATSAFRPAEPRKVLDMVITESDVPVDATVKPGRVPLDIDLNVVDDNALEESQNAARATGFDSGIVSNREAPTKVFGGFDLDLNQVDGGTENGQLLPKTNNKPGAPLLPVKLASAGFPNGEANAFRDFDLNNGPTLGEVCTEQVPRSQHSKGNNNASFVPAVAGIRMNNPELGVIPTWFPPGNSYPAVSIPSILPDRGEQHFPIVAAASGAPRILGSVSGGGTFGGDIYRGPVLASSPAMAFSPATAFPYAGYPFGSNFPIASTSFSGVSTSNVDAASGTGLGFAGIPSQFLGPPAVSVSSHYPRPFVINIPESSSSVGSDNNRIWGRQNLDLNAGPGSGDIEGKDERPSLVSRQLTSQAFSEEHAKLYGAPGVSLKRKEPEGSWDAERSYKQLTWQ